jgi:hypothetical protein
MIFFAELSDLIDIQVLAGGDKPPPLHTNLSLKVVAGFIPA